MLSRSDHLFIGVAYTIDPEHDEVVREYLGRTNIFLGSTLLTSKLTLRPDYREKDGYTVESVNVYGVHDGEERVLIEGVSYLFFSPRLMLIAFQGDRELVLFGKDQLL